MTQTKGLTLKDFNYINSTFKSIAKCEKYCVKTQDLRQQIYMLGLFTFRQFHKAGLPIDFSRPELSQPSIKLNEYASKNSRIHNCNSTI